ncbi:MAG: hypothetical protein KJ638_13510 [Chloroflexi bacterium]|nr:hypothetical protein [Chloroflexota bacterium]
MTKLTTSGTCDQSPSSEEPGEANVSRPARRVQWRRRAAADRPTDHTWAAHSLP